MRREQRNSSAVALSPALAISPLREETVRVPIDILREKNLFSECSSAPQTLGRSPLHSSVAQLLHGENFG